MIRLKKHEGLGRQIRQDDTPDELTIPTSTLAKEAIKSGNAKEAMRWMDYEALEDNQGLADLLKMPAMAIMYIDKNFGAEALDKFWGHSQLPTAKLSESEIRRSLSMPALILAKESVNAGKMEEAIRWLDYLIMEDRLVHDAVVKMTDRVLTFLAENFGEEQVEQFWRYRYLPSVTQMIKALPEAKDLFMRQAEYARVHQSDFSLSEEPDRFVRVNRICGSGGRIRRGEKVGTTKKAYPWSWGKKGIPYYCVHCAVEYEMLPIELQGTPIRITEIGPGRDDLCINYYYKKPELIPAKYYARVGKTKKK